MLSTPNEERPEPEQGVHKARIGPPSHSIEYVEGEAAATYLLRLLGGGFATSQALRQALHEVMARGQADMLRGFCDQLQEALQATKVRDEDHT
jgi:hypothetical protein